MTRILLGQLASNGDCLYATAVARQIKQDFPGCHLTWAVSSLSAKVLANIPEIDALWEIPIANWDQVSASWQMFEAEALRLAEAGVFDHLFLTQISPGRFANFDGTVRPSLFRNFGRSITVPVDVTILLDDAESAAVDAWFADSAAADASQVVLFECSSKSGQSFMTLPKALEMADAVTAERRHATVIISTHEPVETTNPRILSAGALSIRQMARLSHHVDLFVGCGSGLTVAATAGAAKPQLPNIQILSEYTSVYASFRHDFAYFGKPTDFFLELTSQESAYLQSAVIAALSDGFASAKAKFDSPVPLTFDWYIALITQMLVDRGLYADAAQSLVVTAERYGWHPELRHFGRHFILPLLKDDPRSRFGHRRTYIEAFKAGVAGAL